MGEADEFQLGDFGMGGIHIRRGGYVLKDCAGTPQAVVIATGSEVGLAVSAQQTLAEKGIALQDA